MFEFPGRYAENFAVAADGTIFTLVGGATEPGHRIWLWDPSGDAGMRGVAPMPDDFPVSKIMSVSVSLSGDMVAFGSTNKVIVLNSKNRAVLYEGDGRSPSMSPRGDRLAFVDSSRGFVIRDLRRGSNKRFLPWERVGGLGAWSPDGRFVLAGLFGLVYSQERLVAVDSSNAKRCLVLDGLGYDDIAGRFAWVSRAFLSKSNE
jgi:hypothetical protein